MTTALRIENLGKRYQVDHEAARAGYRTLRETLVECAAHALSPAARQASIDATRSGRSRTSASTCRRARRSASSAATAPARARCSRSSAASPSRRRGRVEIHGRVGSLLEVGTGFHPELTGRENIYLNGSILGMSRQEINRKFDEIVDFAEIEQFLDTPVKRYSSGMYVRLAFAVAAHLEPEILIVDEVLAVGDAEFQRRCLEQDGAVDPFGRDRACS